MGTNIKATILACVFTLLLSVCGAYGVLKIDDTKIKMKIESIEKSLDSRFAYITEIIESQQRSVYVFQEQIEKMTSNYAARTEASVDKLDSAMCRFANKVEILSNSIARLDERLKPIEAGRNCNGT
jgi:hypothetical protein